jgi:hypothetical protein
MTIAKPVRYEARIQWRGTGTAGRSVVLSSNRSKKMPISKNRLTIVTLLFVVAWNGAAEAQGTKDPSNPVPTMVFPIRPRDEAPQPRIIRQTPTPAQAPIRLQRIRPVR